MRFDFGSEALFLNFMHSISASDRIALISHTDLDGIAAAKVAQEVIHASLVRFVNYEELNADLVAELRAEGINRVVFTDLFIGNPEFVRQLEHFAHVLILDHHLSSHDWNSEKTVFIKCEDGYSAGYLCYDLFSKVKDVSYLDWLVACCCISDYCHVKPAQWLEVIFKKYGDVFEIQGRYVRMSGRIWDLQETLSLSIIYHKDQPTGLVFVFDSIGNNPEDVGSLGEHAREVREEVSRLLNEYPSKREPFPGGYLYVLEPRFPCGSMVSSILGGREQSSIILTVRPDPVLPIYHVSARRQDKQQNMADFLKHLVAGLQESDAGGHVPAAGGHFLKSDLEEVRRRLGIKA